MMDRAFLVATSHLKRFKIEGTSAEKITIHVVFPLELELQLYTIINEINNELKYRLYAVDKHFGLKHTSGNYICYIRSPSNTWHKLNDSKVTRVE